MKDLWDQTTIDVEVMHYFIVLAFISMIMTFIFSGVINAGSHFSTYELPLLQKYVIIFVMSNCLLSLMFFISLSSFENGSYISLISMILILLQWIIYFYIIQPTFLLFEFKKSYTKLDNLINNSINKFDKAFYEDYKNIEDHKIMSEHDFRIKSHQIALAFVVASKKEENKTLYVNPKDRSFTETARREYNIISGIVVSFVVFNFLMQIVEIILISTDNYTEIGCIIYGLLKILINLAFLIYFPVKVSQFQKLLRKLNLPIKISSILIIAFVFNVQKPLTDIICIWTEKVDAINYAMIINFFMLSIENFIISIVMLYGYSYKGLCFSEYKNILARFKLTLDVRITENVPHSTSYVRYEDDKSGQLQEGSLMTHMETKEDTKKN